MPSSNGTEMRQKCYRQQPAAALRALRAGLLPEMLHRKCPCGAPALRAFSLQGRISVGFAALLRKPFGPNCCDRPSGLLPACSLRAQAPYARTTFCSPQPRGFGPRRAGSFLAVTSDQTARYARTHLRRYLHLVPRCRHHLRRVLASLAARGFACANGALRARRPCPESSALPKSPPVAPSALGAFRQSSAAGPSSGGFFFGAKRSTEPVP